MGSPFYIRKRKGESMKQEGKFILMNRESESLYRRFERLQNLYKYTATPYSFPGIQRHNEQPY